MVQLWRMAVAVAVVGLPGAGAVLAADDEKQGTGERVLGGVISGMLGTPQQSSDAAYTAR
mgnify:CR=1 FL=1